MDLHLAGKKVIVTGGASNIGRGVTLAFLQEGCDVVVWDIDEDAAGRMIEAANEQGLTAPTHRVVDIRDPDAVETATQEVARTMGRIDILANVAGGSGGPHTFTEQVRDVWKWEVELNLWGIVNTCRSVLPIMQAQQYGRIVSIASEVAKIGGPRAALYAAAKGGVVALSKSLAREYGSQGITVNCVCPGPVPPASRETAGMFWTDERIKFTSNPPSKGLLVLPRMGTPQDIANTMVFIASDRCAWVTGQAWSVGGGETMH